MYKDITTHSRGDKEKKPCILENNVNGIMFRVHKHIYYGDQWLFTCRELGVEQEKLNTEDMEKAKEKGIEVMKKLLSKRIEEFKTALEQLDLDKK